MTKPPPRTWKQHAVTAFVTLHLAVVVVASIGPARLEVPEKSWAGLRWNNSVREVFPLMRAYGDLLGPKQVWGMFRLIGTHTHGVQIDAVTPNGFRKVFVQRSDEADWNRLAFDHYRWREMFGLLAGNDPKERRRSPFVEWVAPRVAEVVPDACRVVVRVKRAQRLTPEQLRAGETLSFDQPLWRGVWHVPGRTCQ